MDKNQDEGIPQVRYGPISWLNNDLRATVEDRISRHREYAWRIKDEKDYSEFAYHRCAILSDGSYAVFIKYSETANAKQQFAIEEFDLKFLHHKAGIPVPTPIEVVEVETGWLLIMEAVKAIGRGPQEWRQIGQTLARIHRFKAEDFGFERDGFWGPLYQDNRPMRDWPTFFLKRRLQPILKMAFDSNNLPHSMIAKTEILIPHLSELCGPEVIPTLLHGDAQQNNFISTAQGAYVIDPAVYYGHPEMDLALIDSFQPVPDDFYDGYQDEIPMDPGFYERRDLWRLPLYLSAVALEGPMHLDKLSDALKKYS